MIIFWQVRILEEEDRTSGPERKLTKPFLLYLSKRSKKRSSKNAEAVKRQQYLIQHQSNILLQKVEA